MVNKFGLDGRSFVPFKDMAKMFLILMAVLFAVVQTQSCGKNPILKLMQFSNTIGMESGDVLGLLKDRLPPVYQRIIAELRAYYDCIRAFDYGEYGIYKRSNPLRERQEIAGQARDDIRPAGGQLLSRVLYESGIISPQTSREQGRVTTHEQGRVTTHEQGRVTSEQGRVTSEDGDDDILYELLESIPH